MQRLGTAYTMYFNKRNERSGSLFQGKFKSVQIDSDEHLLWVSAYVNGNAQIHGIIPDATQYEWCGYPEYLGKSKLNICNKSVILDKFKDIASFQKASEECFMKMKERKDLQKYILD
jgi:putative transposase